MSAVNEGIDIGERLPINIVEGTRSQLVGFLVLNMWPSHFGLWVLLFLVLSRRVKRHATFANLCISFIIIGLSSSLLVYAGRTTGPEPSRMLCLLQASLLYGMPALASTSVLSLVLQMFYMIKAAYDGVEYLDRDHVIRVWTMLIGPYIVFFISMLVTAVIGAANPSSVSRNRRFFYCSVDCAPLTNTITVVSAIVLLSTLILMACTMTLIYRRMKLSKMNAPRPRWTLELNFPFRIMVFGLYIIVAFSLDLLSITTPSSPVPDLVIALAATLVILIFGTQRDILRALCFWKSPSPQEVPEAVEVNLKKMFGSESDSKSPSWMNKPLPSPPPSYITESRRNSAV